MFYTTSNNTSNNTSINNNNRVYKHKVSVERQKVSIIEHKRK